VLHLPDRRLSAPTSGQTSADPPAPQAK